VVRDLLLLPGVPRRLLDDIRELKELVRELLSTEEELTRTSASMDRKVSALDTTNDYLEKALEDEIRHVRSATDEIKEIVPDVGRGPLAKAKDALSGE
jgi:chromosome segregation ATPase